MRRPFVFFGLLLTCVAGLRAQYRLAEPDWTIELEFAAKPKADNILTPSPQGDVKADRFFTEAAGEHSMVIRFTYPMAMPPGAETGLYDRSIADLMRSRPGQLRSRERYQLGPFDGERIVIFQPRENSIREIRLVVVGSTLYVLSAEWPAQGTGADRARAFFASVKLRPDSTDLRVVQERERWRVFDFGKFQVRLDGTRWYRDPGDQDPGVFDFIRPDDKAEAQFIAEVKPFQDGDIGDSVIKTAKDGADSLRVRHRGVKLRGAVEVEEIEFDARVGDASYVNHGYFYAGPQGTVQLRAWAKADDYPAVTGDITELLDGLKVAPK